MAVKFRGRTLLNPQEKGMKAADELRNNIMLTNDGNIKFDSFGKPQKLTKEQRAYRVGYLVARNDSAKCYKAQQKKSGKR